MNTRRGEESDTAAALLVDGFAGGGLRRVDRDGVRDPRHRTAGGVDRVDYRRGTALLRDGPGLDCGWLFPLVGAQPVFERDEPVVLVAVVRAFGVLELGLAQQPVVLDHPAVPTRP